MWHNLHDCTLCIFLLLMLKILNIFENIMKRTWNKVTFTLFIITRGDIVEEIISIHCKKSTQATLVFTQKCSTHK